MQQGPPLEPHDVTKTSYDVTETSYDVTSTAAHPLLADGEETQIAVRPQQRASLATVAMQAAAPPREGAHPGEEHRAEVRPETPNSAAYRQPPQQRGEREENVHSFGS